MEAKSPEKTLNIPIGVIPVIKKVVIKF